MATATIVLSQRQTKITVNPPPLYRVLVLNDDYTPMEFVVEVLMQVFSLNLTKATQVMLQVHHEGKGVCGVFAKDVAETKASQVMSLARQAGHPLRSTIESDRN